MWQRLRPCDKCELGTEYLDFGDAEGEHEERGVAWSGLISRGCSGEESSLQEIPQ